MIRSLAFVAFIVTFSVHAAGAQDLLFDADQFGDINLSYKQSTASAAAQYEAILGASAQFEPLVIYGQTSRIRALSQPIGRLDIRLGNEGIETCTASVISSDYILTNYHCIPGTGENGKVTAAQLVMGYYDVADTSEVELYRVSIDPIDADETLDYAVLRVFGNPAKKFGTVRILNEDPEPGASLIVFHHPLGKPKHVTLAGCRVAPNYQATTDEIFHACDTLPGSSGAPLFAELGRGVLGLHYAGPGSLGPGQYNFAKRMTRILSESATLRMEASFDTPLVEEEIAASDIPHQVDEVLNKVMYVTDVSSIAVYRDDSTKADVLGTLEPGERVIVTGRINSGQDGRAWYQIVGPNGEIGYVFAVLLTDDGPETEPATAEALPTFEVTDQTGTRFTTGAANVREGPSTNFPVITQLSGGTEVNLTGKVAGRNWFRIELADGREGFVSGRLLSETRQPAAEPEPEIEDTIDFVDARETPSSVRAPLISVDPATLPDFALFRECEECPDMVVIPSGSFLMGSPSSELYRGSDEGPRQRITISRFAISRFETTVEQWFKFLGGPLPEEPGNHPKTNVGWDEAVNFGPEIISRKLAELGINARYRLPTEAEWEYAARGNTTSVYPWGARASHAFANYGNDQCCSGLASGRDQWVKKAPVGQFPDNGFGLYDMHGNVFEWVEDCYRDSLSGQDSNGAAYLGCTTDHVIRGGSYMSIPAEIRTANRNNNSPLILKSERGFRLARALD